MGDLYWTAAERWESDSSTHGYREGVILGKMLFFYELIIRLPNDLARDCPGMSETCMDALLHSSVELPPKAVWDMSKVNLGMVSMAQCIVRILVCFWQMLNPLVDTPYFIQLEEGKQYYHLHCLLSWKACDSLVLGRYIKKVKERIIEAAFGGIEPGTTEWFAVHKTRTGGKNKVVDALYIERYLLPKKQSEVQWAWTDIPEYKDAVLDASRRAMFQLQMPVACLEDMPGDPGAVPGPSISGSSAENYCRLVDWLVSEGITSERQWLQKDKLSYRSFHANSNSSRQIKAALENAKAEMLLTRTAGDYLVGGTLHNPIDTNKIFLLFCLNNYDPQVAATILLKWCRCEWGKRNTVWFTGPASTGKTNLAEAIAHAVPLYGCVNWTNENFPFNDCVGKMLIWWEEGKMTAKIVESAKAILGGSKVRVDQKCKNSIQVDPTPVIITSNVDMTLVIDGNTITAEHREPLEHRMWKFTFEHQLEPTWGKICKEEVLDFFCWAAERPVEVAPTYCVPKVAGGGVLPPPEVDLTEDMDDEDIPAAQQPIEVDFALSTEIDGQQVVVSGPPPSPEPGTRSVGTSTEEPAPLLSTTPPAESATLKSPPRSPDPQEGPSSLIAPPAPKKSRYGTRLVCLEHNQEECEICGEELCLFTAGFPTPETEDSSSSTSSVDLQCHETLSDMSGLSDVSPPSPPTPDPPVGSPVPLIDLFDDMDYMPPFRYQPE
ncbi:nonstructural protein 1 [Desmodus rotundus dependoparvovirus]|uniref:Nonstructural protein 1 n=1 Tax=Desmodus rotundus dependoparvovirus TaxID=2137542 RepID=A0A2Z3DB42_9VIRU|nr:nonstructural protein 1 [Desmodus rotundus dependoparvovirus]AVR53758.1 nonstructural protein 1 [Desmodus rotundus dependoparvovirus]